MHILTGQDLKFDRDNQIKGAGTPVDKMTRQDLPSPVCTRNSKNASLLACSANVFDYANKHKLDEAVVDENTQSQYKQRVFKKINYLDKFK